MSRGEPLQDWFWLAWARRVWAEELRKRDAQENTFDVIENAYKRNKGNVLLALHAEHIRQMKRVFTERRAMFFPLRASAELCDLLSYEGGRRAP